MPERMPEYISSVYIYFQVPCQKLCQNNQSNLTFSGQGLSFPCNVVPAQPQPVRWRGRTARGEAGHVLLPLDTSGYLAVFDYQTSLGDYIVLEGVISQKFLLYNKTGGCFSTHSICLCVLS